MSQYLEHLQAIFQRLREVHLKLKSSKCHFFQKLVTFLGHIVGEQGISTDSDKVQKITECPTPKDVHDVKSVLGFSAVIDNSSLILVRQQSP